MISFVVPINKRKLDRLEGLIYNIKSFYSDYEIIIAEQDSKEGFKLGQMRNMGFNKSKGDIIVFIDVDMRFIKKIDFKLQLKSIGKPFIAWKRIAQVKEDLIGTFKIVSKAKIGFGEGGCVVIGRMQFQSCYGYSNLMIGWGKEDHLLCYRLKFRRFEKIKVDMYHVIHDKERKAWGVDPIALEHNMKMLLSDSRRDKSKDSYVQTIADEKVIKIDGVINHYFFSNVRVPSDFAFMDLYNKMESFQIKKK